MSIAVHDHRLFSEVEEMPDLADDTPRMKLEAMAASAVDLEAFGKRVPEMDRTELEAALVSALSQLEDIDELKAMFRRLEDPDRARPISRKRWEYRVYRYLVWKLPKQLARRIVTVMIVLGVLWIYHNWLQV